MDLILLVKGIIAGFVIAAPIGPVGILCVQRTLSHGMPMGLSAGFGGAVADIGKSVGGSIGGSVGRALVRGALGGLLRR